ncbi:MAG TPA: hypothetical protein VFB70_04950 [Pyrinomonadaceae bacterium]|nr:hypothetical protein [Pyrinomonadaceae bacterium]
MTVIIRPTVTALLLLITLTATTVAQQKRQTPAKPQPRPTAPAPTFETLVPAESYTLYVEIRSVGQLIQSNAVNEILEPVLKLAGPPKEFKSLVKWLNTHAEDLMSSRLLVATWPTGGKNVPETLVAIEFASVEDAAKFATKLNQMLPTVLPPVPAPTPEGQALNPKGPAPPPEPAYGLQQAGSLILLTPRPLDLKKVKPAGGKLLAEDNSFRSARNRFGSEPIFVFIDVKVIQRQQEEQRKKVEEQVAQSRIVAVNQNLKKQEEAQAEKKSEEPPEPEPAEPQFVPEKHTEVELSASAETGKLVASVDPMSSALTMMASSFFSGESNWPDAVGLAVSFEGESFDVRALLVNSPGEKSDTIPFVPMLIPGPPLVSEASTILPADTELFATMSLDLPQIYAMMSKPRPNAMYYAGRVPAENEEPFQPPFAAIEKQLKMSLKDDLLPLLGSEVAIRLPVTGLDVFGVSRGPAPLANTKDNPTPEQSPGKTAPVVLISVKDKEGVRAWMPKLVEAIGFKGASAFANTERKEDTELVSYVNLFAYAFIGNFLVISSDPAATRHVVDSYLKHETLASDSNFRSYTRWQPRPAYGQLYISPALMESYKSWIESPSTRLDDLTKMFLLRMVAGAQPITYSLSNEGFGPLHELHVPRNLILMAVAGISNGTNPTPVQRNEGTAIGLMYMIASLQEQYKIHKGAGSYGTLEQLIAADLIPKEMVERSGYKFEITFTGDKFEVNAVPVEYGKTGTMSYFIDQTMVLRGADRAGASATSSDPQIH